MRVLIAAGGTGGHVYPALAVAESLTKTYPETRLYFVGSIDGFERPLIEHAGIHFEAHDEVQAGPLHGVNPLQMVSSIFKLTVGTFQAFGLLRKYKPQVIFSTGGWVSLPVALAARILGKPMVIYLPDIEPGLTIKVLRLFATKVAVTVPESETFFRQGQMVVTGYPLRSVILNATREAGIAYFKLDPARKTLLIFGGSRGARAINVAIGNILKSLLDDGIQVIHVTGTLDWERMQQQVGVLAQHPNYHAVAYLHDEMGLAYAAADLVVCRSGASILGEFPVFQLPSILIPLAYSWRYQQVNAEYLEKRGAAIHLDENQIDTKLLPTIREVLGDENRLQEMKACAAALARPDGAENVANVLAQLVQDRSSL